ncbi:MAG: hypothetical protein IJO73_05215 [Clostridia bacterium]|nr:hypothetical protein [Clostridia bacterium]
MKEWLSQHGYLLFVFAGVCILAAVIFYFAVRAYSKHNALYRAQEAEMKRLLALKERYMNFTEETLASADEGELLEGVALSYQLRLQKQEEPEKAFELLGEEKQKLYVLDVFCADGDVRTFFSENGKIVKSRILPALDMIGMGDFALKLKDIYGMYDEENEEISFSENKIAEMNELILRDNILTKIKAEGAKYIKNNFNAVKN